MLGASVATCPQTHKSGTITTQMIRNPSVVNASAMAAFSRWSPTTPSSRRYEKRCGQLRLRRAPGPPRGRSRIPLVVLAPLLRRHVGLVGATILREPEAATPLVATLRCRSAKFMLLPGQANQFPALPLRLQPPNPESQTCSPPENPALRVPLEMSDASDRPSDRKAGR